MEGQIKTLLDLLNYVMSDENLAIYTPAVIVLVWLLAGLLKRNNVGLDDITAQKVDTIHDQQKELNESQRDMLKILQKDNKDKQETIDTLNREKMSWHEFSEAQAELIREGGKDNLAMSELCGRAILALMRHDEDTAHTLAKERENIGS